MKRVVRVESFVFRAPIKVPIRTSFGTLPNRPALFVRIEDQDGAFGWGEIWCNFPLVGAEYRARLFDTILAPRLLEFDSETSPVYFWDALDHDLHIQSLQTGEPGAFSGVLGGADMALHDLAARRAGVPLWRQLGGYDASPVPTYASGLNSGPAALDLLFSSRDKGFAAFKIKVGFGEKNDTSTLRPVAEVLEHGETVMVDANQGWNIETACRMAKVLGQFPLSWIEEPIAADRPVSEWAMLKSATQIPLAGGENLQGASAFDEALADGCLSVLQPDMCKWGGLSGVLRVARKIIGAGKTFCPHFLGGGIGLFASLHLFAVVRGPGRAEVDINPNPLREDLVGDLLCVRNGFATLPQGPGLGFEPNISPFERLRTLHTETRS